MNRKTAIVAMLCLLFAVPTFAEESPTQWLESKAQAILAWLGASKPLPPPTTDGGPCTDPNGGCRP